MSIFNEKREGDTNVRAGIVIRCGDCFLAEYPTPSAQWKHPLWDIPKGHIQVGETPRQAAIREVWEETNIKFEPWKLTHPIKVMCDGEPMFLFLADLKERIPTSLLSCKSTFNDNGTEKPECCEYRWINAYTEMDFIQPRLREGILQYFNGVVPCNEDCQTSASVAGCLPENPLEVISYGYKRDPNIYKENSNFASCRNYRNEVRWRSSERNLYEMGWEFLSSKRSGLPFKIIVQNNERFPPHAHIKPDEKSRSEYGAFEITTTIPKKISDLVPFTKAQHKGLEGIGDADKLAIIKWARENPNDDKHKTNWEAMLDAFIQANRDGKSKGRRR